MREERTSCACLNVVYAPVQSPGNDYWRERWVCDQCGREFVPKNRGGKMSTKDGGPAFPVLAYDKSGGGDIRPQPTVYEGISRRQWLAGLAMQGMMSDPEWYEGWKWGEQNHERREIARYAYAVADAMLAYEAEEEK